MYEKWAGLAWLTAIALIVAGLAGVANTVIPLNLGDANWEVAAFGELGGTLAPTTIGVVLLGLVGAQRRKASATLTAAVLAAVVGGLASLGALILLLDVPLVRQVTASGSPTAVQLRVLTAKSIALCGVYALALWVFAGYFVRVTRLVWRAR